MTFPTGTESNVSIEPRHRLWNPIRKVAPLRQPTQLMVGERREAAPVPQGTPLPRQIGYDYCDRRGQVQSGSAMEQADMRALLPVLLASAVAACAAEQPRPSVAIQRPLPHVPKIPGNYGPWHRDTYESFPSASSGSGGGYTSSTPSNGAPATSSSDPHYTCHMGTGGDVERNCRRDGYL